MFVSFFNSNLFFLAKYNEPPKIDISEGLRQIEENKRIIEDGLLEIEKEVDKLGQKGTFFLRFF